MSQAASPGFRANVTAGGPEMPAPGQAKPASLSSEEGAGGPRALDRDKLSWEWAQPGVKKHGDSQS